MAKEPKPEKTGRIAQLRQAYTLTKPNDPSLPYILVAVFVGVLARLRGDRAGDRQPVVARHPRPPVAVLATMFVLSRRVEKAAFSSIEGQPGAAAAVLNTLRRGWTVTPAVAVTRNQDLVHRVTGRPGVVLVAEGRPPAAVNLLTAERKRTSRVLGDSPVHEILVGDGEGQIPLKKLSRTVMKLPRALTASEVTELNYRLKALDNQRGQLRSRRARCPRARGCPRCPRPDQSARARASAGARPTRRPCRGAPGRRGPRSGPARRGRAGTSAHHAAARWPRRRPGAGRRPR